MEYKVLSSAEQLPIIDRLLLETEIAADEHDFFCFGEGSNGVVYCLINEMASDIYKKRAQTLRIFHFELKTVEVLYTSSELLSIFRDQASMGEEFQYESESELDKRFNDILIQAIKANSSDIHFDIFPNRAEVKYRINGLICKVGEIDARTINRLMNYVYNVAAAEGSKDIQFNPDDMQDALLDRMVIIDDQSKHFKLRLQTAPCYPNSITIVMRILPVDSQLSSTLESLGYSERQIDLLKSAQMRPTGATIIAGTTGSGKSTTLATMLHQVYKRTKGVKKILTTEDPPEYAIPGANQINLSVKKSEEDPDENVFIKSIKVAMRCDPDIIMVGEVRDKQSSQLLSSAVLSGHQVFTTVHAASALSIYHRLVNLGFEKHVLVSPNFLSLLIYQALVPIICKKCAIPFAKFESELDSEFDAACVERVKKIVSSADYAQQLEGTAGIDGVYFANEGGCKACRMGYAGRTVLAEIVEPTFELLDHMQQSEFDKAMALWKAAGGQTVLEHGISKMLAGEVDPRSVEDKCGLLTDGLAQ